MSSKYLKRISDKTLKLELEASGAVLIEGPKWCGKTRTAEEIAASVLYMQDPEFATSNIKAAEIKPSLLLDGAKPRLIDEWQVAPSLWDAVRFAVDRVSDSGQYILTGSRKPKDSEARHTGTGRISRMLMRPMSLFESGESNGNISLATLFGRQKSIECISGLTIENLAFVISRGGWPESIGQTEAVALRKAHNYVEAIIHQDISEADDVDKDPAKVRALLRSLARNVSTLASITTIKDDIPANEAAASDKTITAYMNALRKIFVVEDLPAWSPALRSKTAVRTSVKRHFTDPSIAIAVLRASPQRLLGDFNTFGYLFESMCIRDLRIYSEAIDGEVFHYRDKSELEADAIIQLKDGQWAAVEIKMGASAIEDAAKNLRKLVDKVDLAKMNPPTFLMILTATEYGYTRHDGIHVVPIACLKD